MADIQFRAETTVEIGISEESNKFSAVALADTSTGSSNKRCQGRTSVKNKKCVVCLVGIVGLGSFVGGSQNTANKRFGPLCGFVELSLLEFGDHSVVEILTGRFGWDDDVSAHCVEKS